MIEVLYLFNKTYHAVYSNIKNKLLIIYILITTRDSWKKIKKCSVLLIRQDNDCGYTFENKKYSTLIDSTKFFFENNGYRCETIAAPYSRYIGKETHSFALSMNRSYFFFTLLSKIVNTKSFDRVNLWKKLLELSKPSIIIGIQPDLYLCKASLIQGIAVYDLQHGSIESSIRYYSSFSNIKGFERVKPTGFLLWDSASKRIIENSNIAKPNTIIVEHPFMFRFKKKSKIDKLVNDANEQWQSTFNNDKPNILITMQWGLREIYNTKFDFLPIEIFNIINQTKNKYNYFIRAHPVNQIEQINFLKKKFIRDQGSVNVIDATKMPLPILLFNSNLHITHHSAVTIEASYYGVKTLLLNSLMAEGCILEDLFSYQRNNGFAELVNVNEYEINKAIENNLLLSKKKSSGVNTEEVFLSLIQSIMVG